MKSLTIFSAPKPFTDPHIATIQRNAIHSWCMLGDQVEVILVGDEEGMAETARELGVKHLSGVACNDQG
ncbi:MAG: glycosyl transferase family 2, partial [Anaerolineales bacterium]